MLVYVSVLESGCQSDNGLTASLSRKEISPCQSSADRILLIDLSDQRFAAMRTLVQQMLGNLASSAGEANSAKPDESSSEMTDSKRTVPLSPREREVLSLSAEGHSYDSIAKALGISINTVRYHMKRLNVKLDVHNRVAAINKARTKGEV
jgi:DNA-binding CsgD family transcriptional regulator